MYTPSNRKNVKRMSTATSVAIILAFIIGFLIAMYLGGADFRDTFRRISY